MTPERMFRDLLGLGLSWEVISSRFDPVDSKVILEIQETPLLWENAHCPKEGGQVSCYDHTEVLVWRHLNVFQHRCEIHCRLPRAKCRQCGHIHRVRPPWEGLSIHFTKEFEAFALLLIRQMPMAQAAKMLNEHDTRLWNMVKRQVEAARKEMDLSHTICVGVDELSARKGQFISIFADLPAKKVIFATPGKDHQTWSDFSDDLLSHNGHPHAITQVSMDMSNAFEKGVRATCRNAQIVFDKFHVLRYASMAVDKVREVELRFGGVAKYLKRSLWLWRKNPENLNQSERERMGKMPAYLHTAKAYQMRLALRGIFQMETRTQAQWHFRVWRRWVQWVAKKNPWSLYQPMVRVAKMLKKNMEGILGHWKSGITNAFMEGINSLIQAAKRKARGYRSNQNLITMLYLIAGKLKLPQF